MKKVKVSTEAIALEQIPNIGPSLAEDLRLCGVSTPAELVGRNPVALYDELCRRTGVRHDPCVLDTFMSAVRFMEGAPPHPWWHYTEERKAMMQAGASSTRPKTKRAR
ncbi:mitomycin resistance protein [Permianibacter sp. IMCC34836]|uniref:helix-hairpin-helix domain-containing protein n=1 Tax=Permianibacter fluminis TaxID=2738515 RepID=UPI001552985E|nr:helix-hairpin-helix domain-containing protein [Permianibacter fluminis]NQD37831.1 mitomycin resistance protein [Permianibacter fluminis]